MELSGHATNKLDTYGISGERLSAWKAALQQGQHFLDLTTSATVVVTEWEARTWITILSQNGERVITTYPTDHRTVANRIGAKRWLKTSS